MNIHVIKGFLAAAAIPVCAACFAATVFNFLRSGGFGGFALSVVAAIIIAAPISVAITLFIGVPAYYAANRFRRRSLSFYLVCGAVISAAISALLALDIPTAANGDLPQLLLGYYMLAVALISGPLATAGFWAVARPDWVSEQSEPK